MTESKECQFTWTSGHISVTVGVTFDTSYGIVEHLVVKSLEPEKTRLPITETGYRSHFVPPGTVPACGGPVEAARKLLDEAAKAQEWQEYLQDSRQGSLF